jgi:DNA invertase Pin-like site-specific DNA recombinase
MDKEYRKIQLVIDLSKLELRRKYQREIAMEYNVSVMTLNRWLKKHGIEVERGYVTGAKQLEIYEALGWPECYLKLSA